MTVSLDLGTSRFRSMRRRERRLIVRQEAACYTALDASPSQQSVLARAQVPYSQCKDSLIVLGQSAVEIAASFQTPLIPLLPHGRLPEEDPVARQLLVALTEAILPAASRPGEICCMTVPGHPDPQQPTRAFEFFTHLVELRGYRPVVLNAGMALLLSEAAGSAFTGIGLSCGAAGCDISIALHGMQVAHEFVPGGGDQIDELLAASKEDYLHDSQGNRYLNVQQIRQWKHAAERNLTRADTADERQLTAAYEGIVTRVLRRCDQMLSGHRSASRLRRPLDVLVAGGLTQIADFEEFFRHHCHVTQQIDPRRVRFGGLNEHGVVRGCLIGGTLEADERASTADAA